MKYLLAFAFIFSLFKPQAGLSKIVRDNGKQIKKGDKADATESPVGNCSGCTGTH